MEIPECHSRGLVKEVLLKRSQCTNRFWPPDCATGLLFMDQAIFRFSLTFIFLKFFDVDHVHVIHLMTMLPGKELCTITILGFQLAVVCHLKKTWSDSNSKKNLE